MAPRFSLPRYDDVLLDIYGMYFPEFGVVVSAGVHVTHPHNRTLAGSSFTTRTLSVRHVCVVCPRVYPYTFLHASVPRSSFG